MFSKNLLFAFVVLFSASLKAQTKPVPETLNEINYYNAQKNVLQKLEKNPVKFTTKMKALGMGGAETVFEMDGVASSVRLAQSDGVHFIVAMVEANGDPTGWFGLYKADIKKKKRIGKWMKTAVFGGKNATASNVITYSVKKIKDGCYEIIPNTKLEKGEYLFVNKGTLSTYGGQGADAFAFGVD
ncbi:MAG: hypothetical protein J0H92_19410 [Sphingobacteriales bacterium]|nr:hypothetical protein [Sphingobacteriales bacterium]OJW32091.1 MAG: hypothetical protein BGO54_16895 [Sphingobacteriales bacterium 46-32]